MSSAKNSTIKLPRLRTKDELLKTSPELFNKLLLGDDMSSARSSVPQASKAQHAQQAAAGRPSSRPGSHKAGQLTLNYDTPRGFGDEPLTVDQELAIELESVKRERQQLLESIAQVKAESGTAGGEAQQADIRQLLKELELKKAKLNELRGDSRETEAAIAKMRDDDTDAQRLTPDDCIAENAYIQSLRDEMTHVEEDLLEAEAKNRLYYLLGERTRREHMAIDQKVRDKQESKRACLEDLANLNEHYNTTRAAKELAEKELAKTKRQVEEARADWMRKIRERRAEVRDLNKRQQKEREKDIKRREKQLEKEKAEKAAQAKLKMEQEAYNLQVTALAPKIEAMEASWNRLRAISGAETPNEVVEYWQGLKAKEQHMHELVALAEKREAACKSEISQLLASRSAMFESSKAAAAMAAAAVAAAAAAVEAANAAGTGPQTSGESLDAVNARIEAAEKRMDAAQVQFNKLRSICVAAEQGMRSLLHRLQLALEDAPPGGATLPPLPHLSHHLGTALGQAGQAAGAVQVGTAGSRLQSAGASSNAGSHAEGMRRSAGGAASNRQGRTTKEVLDNALASKARVNSSAHARDAQPTGAAADVAAANLALVPEDASAASVKAGIGFPGAMATLPLAGLASNGPASAAATSRPNLPSRGKNTIEDDSFFEGLPRVLADVTEKLEKLLVMGEGLDYAAIQAAAAGAAEGSMLTVGSSNSTAPNTARAQYAAATAAAACEAAAATCKKQQQEDEQASDGGANAAVDGEVMQTSESAEATAVGDESATAAQDDSAAAEQQEEGTAKEGEDTAATAAEQEADKSAEDAERANHGVNDGSQEAEAGADERSKAMQAERSELGGDVTASESAAVAAEDTKNSAPGSAVHTAADEPMLNSTAAAEQEPQQQTSGSAAAASTSSSGRSRPASSNGVAVEAPCAAAAAAAATSALVAIRLSATVPAAALAVGGTMHSTMPESEKALLKGLPRRTWTGAPWVDCVGDDVLDMSMIASMKRKKGKKKETAPVLDLSRIMGYTPPNDVPAESDSDGEEDAEAEAGPGTDGVVDREYIKMRAAKMMARHNAKQAAAAAAAQQVGR